MKKAKHRVAVLGASGMLGSTVVKYLTRESEFLIRGSVRAHDSLTLFPSDVRKNLVDGVDVTDFSSVQRFLEDFRPDTVINCVGLVKQLSVVNDPLVALPVNSLFPHLLARYCGSHGGRLIHISTDCVFSGQKGRYLESDIPDAYDLYGVSKRLGEVDYPNAVTLRTSIIGHELNGNRSLIDWFLSQRGSVCGFSQAVFSGLPTVEIAGIIRDHVISNETLCGVYHVSAEPISKFDLLSLVAEIYGHDVKLESDSSFKIDRSLDSSRFRLATGFKPKAWQAMISYMKEFQ